MDTTTRDLERLEAEYRARVAAVRADESLSWEKQELKVRELGLKYDRARRQTGEDAA
jgi:hypothetical protein